MRDWKLTTKKIFILSLGLFILYIQNEATSKLIEVYNEQIITVPMNLLFLWFCRSFSISFLAVLVTSLLDKENWKFYSFFVPILWIILDISIFTFFGFSTMEFLVESQIDYLLSKFSGTFIGGGVGGFAGFKIKSTHFT